MSNLFVNGEELAQLKDLADLGGLSGIIEIEIVKEVELIVYALTLWNSKWQL